MFLKLFKKRSNEKYINNILDNRSVSISSEKIRSVGVIVNLDEFKNYESLINIFSYLGINENKVKFVTFVSEKDATLNSWDSYFTPSEFGWGGSIHNIDVNEFINTKFDALVSYYNSDCFELNLVTAKSKANFKIGISFHDKRLHDFILNIETKYTDVFKNELEKYLKGLNKI